MSKWTFMTLMAAENSLKQYAPVDIEEMKKVGSCPERHILAEVDLPQKETARYYLTADINSDDIIEKITNVNTGSPDTLVEFVNWGFGHWPSSKIALILWNHGWGWDIPDMYNKLIKKLRQPENKNISRSIEKGDLRIPNPLFSTTLEKILTDQVIVRGILGDDGSMDCLDTVELADALRRITQIIGGRPVDLLGMDACLMSMVEIIYQIRDLTKVVVASEEEEPEFGWPYDTVLSNLVKTPDIMPEAFGQEIVRCYIDSYKELSHFGVTQSAIRTSSMPSLVSKIDKMAKVLIDVISTEQGMQKVLFARFSTKQFRGKYGGNYIDLSHFCTLLTEVMKGTDVEKCAHDTIEAAKDCVIENGQLGDSVANATGISIYFPLNLPPSPHYDPLDFAKACCWPELLKKLHSLRG